ncbi:MAG: hypothetical protein RIC55_35935 [Pirellulaceae bacterium]
MRYRHLFVCGLLSLLCFAGCGPQTDSAADDEASSDAAADAGDKHGHSHEGDDQLFWQREDRKHAGCLISLGHHGVKLYQDHDVEPAVSIDREGQAVEDAEVFVSLLDGDQQTLVEESACVYEPPTEKEPAHYAQAKLAIPADIEQAVIRYRIEIPGAESFVYDVTVDVSSHD